MCTHDTTPHKQIESTFMPLQPVYDPLDWPESTEASNDIHSHYVDSTTDPDNLDSFMQSLPSAPANLSSSVDTNTLPRRSTRSRRPPSWMREYFVHTMLLPSEPTCYEEAVSDASWRSAMLDEMDAIARNGTWTLVHLPPGKSAISTKWIFKEKTGVDGQVLRRKARLVARGFEQQHGLDYEEVFAPVVKWATLRTLLAIASQHQYPIYHLDVKTAFLYGLLKEEVYIT
jgi:hypothetical protein